jgi:hypothetical protein
MFEMPRWLQLLAAACATGLALLVPSSGRVAASAPPIAASPAVPPPHVEAAIQETHRVWGVAPALLRCLAFRESSWNPAAYSPVGPYHGIVQFDWPTWREATRRLRNPADPRAPLVAPTASPYEPRAALLTAGGLIAHGEGWRWPPLRWCRSWADGQDVGGRV